jgi:hypothetical protein
MKRRSLLEGATLSIVYGDERAALGGPVELRARNK